MLEWLKKNYKVSLVLSAAVYVITFVFSNWHYLSSLVRFLNDYNKVMAPYWLYTMIFGMVFGLAAYCLLKLIIYLFKRFMAFYVLPINETFFLTVLAFSGANLINGILCLTYYITPLVFVWGQFLYPLISGFPAALWLFKRLKDSFLNEKQAVWLFPRMMTVFLIVNLAATFFLKGGLA